MDTATGYLLGVLVGLIKISLGATCTGLMCGACCEVGVGSEDRATQRME